MIVSPDTFAQNLSTLLQADELALDTETTGLYEHDKIFSVILCDGTDSFYFNFKDYPAEGIVSLGEKCQLELVNFLNNKTALCWYLANAKFDMHMLSKWGVKDLNGEVFCTAAQGRIEKNNHLAYGLASSAERIGERKDSTVEEYITKHKLYTDITVAGKGTADRLKHYDRVPFSIIAPYGMQDGRATFRLGQHLRKSIQASPQLLTVSANEALLTKTCFKIEREGILIDPVYTRDAWKYEEGLIRRGKQHFRELAGVDIPKKKADLIALFKEAGEIIPLTKTGRDSLDDAALSSFKSPLAKVLQDIRYREKRISTYYSSFMYLRDSRDIIRADMVQYGTETGRFSYRSPNLQNIPKEDESPEVDAPYLIRGCFIPRPGNLFVAIDFAQQEYRMMLDYAGEHELIELVMSGMDLHQATADMAGITRKQAKTLNFAILYGAGEEQIATMLGVSRTEARALKMRYLLRLPKVDSLISRAISTGKTRGYIHNWYGRQCHIANRAWAYILPNHLIQGGCADVIKIALNKVQAMIEEKKLRMRIRITIHDEILLELPPEEAEEINYVVEIMENIYPSRNGMKLLTDVSHSFKSFAAKDKLKGIPCHASKNYQS